jgi:putative ABC transport system permease protein
MQQAFNQGDKVYFMACTAKPGYPASLVQEEVTAILKTAHDISPTDEKAIGSFNIEKQFQIFNNLFKGIDILIWFVGMGALLSGIIGISNIMLVTVRERTREIGVRRAVGAKPTTIVKQILSESFVLTALAGIFGFLAGIGIIETASHIMSQNISDDVFLIPPFVSFQTAISALGVLVVSGILSGLMPAMRALRIKAIDAIREE